MAVSKGFVIEGRALGLLGLVDGASDLGGGSKAPWGCVDRVSHLGRQEPGSLGLSRLSL